jgi:hypothetical protein
MLSCAAAEKENKIKERVTKIGLIAIDLGHEYTTMPDLLHYRL